MKLRIFIAGVFAALASVHASPGDGTAWQELTEGERRQLGAGEVVIEQRDTGRDRGNVRVAMLADAKVQRVWNTITSCEAARVYLAGMEHCEILEKREHRMLTRHVVDKGWIMPEVDYTFETRSDPYRRMDIQLVRGNLDAMDGSWTFEETEQGLLVRHRIMVDPRMPAPGWLTRRMISGDLSDMMRCIRALSDGSLSEPQREKDRAACPGRAEP